MSIFYASGANALQFFRQTVLELFQYLKAPQLLNAQRDWGPQAWGALAVLVLIDAALTVPITWFLLGYENFVTSVLSMDAPAYVGMEDETFIEAFLIAVVAAPLLEEPLFRGWLTGKLRHVLFGALWLGWLSIMSVLMLLPENEIIDATVGISLIAVILLSVLIHFVSDRGQPPTSALRYHFPKFFWVSTVTFGLVHVTNYEYDNYLFVIPYVLPQLLAGTIWGFARVRYGLKASIMLHAISNFWITCLFFLWEF